MSFKRLTPFIIILVVLAGLVMLRKSGDEPVSIVEQAGLVDLVPEHVYADNIVKVELYAGAKPEEKVVLEKDNDDNWKIASSYGAPANNEVVQDYLDTIVELKGERRSEVDSDEGFARYNLKDDSTFHLVAYEEDDTDEPSVNLLIGKADGNSVFMRKAGENTIYTEAANPREDAGVYGDDFGTAPTSDKWLKKELLAYSNQDITGVSVKMPGKTFGFEKVEVPVETPEVEEGEEPLPAPAPEYEWQLASGGPGGEFKQTALDNLVLRASSLRAADVVDPEKKADWGLESPLYKLTAVKSDGSEVVIEGGRPDPTGVGYVHIASDDNGMIYEIQSYDFSQLFPKGRDLFTLPEWDFDKEDANRVVIDQPSGRVVISKVGDEWSVTSPSLALEPKTSAITTLVSSLTTWKPEDYFDAGTDAGTFDKSVAVSAGGGAYSVRVGADAEGLDGAYAALEGEDILLAMRSSDIDKLFLEPTDLYNLKLMDLAEPEVKEIEVRQGGTVVTLARSENGWRKTIAADTPDAPFAVSNADTAIADQLAYALAALKASDITLGRNGDVESLYAQITLKSVDGDIHTLRIGPKVNGEHALNFDDQGAVLDLEADAVSGLLEKVAALTKPAEEEEEVPEETPASVEETVMDQVVGAVEDAADAAVETAEEVMDETTVEVLETQAGAVDAPLIAPIPTPEQP